MIQVDEELERAFRENTSVKPWFNVTRNGTYIGQISSDRIMQGTVSLDSYSSPGGSFALGTVITRTLSFSLNNYDGYFDEYNFTDACFDFYLNKVVGTKTYTIHIGKFYVETPMFGGNVISITANDLISKADNITITEGVGDYPKTLSAMITKAKDLINANVSNVSLTVDIPSFFSNITVDRLPEWQNGITVREYLSKIAEFGCCFCVLEEGSTSTVLKFKQYDNLAFYSEDELNGGTFVYTDGDSANGGNFAKTGTESTYDGGRFSTIEGSYYRVSSIKNISVGFDKIEFGGIEVFDKDYDSQDWMITDRSKYIVFITGNPIVDAITLSSTELNTIRNHYQSTILHLAMRPFSVQGLSNPLYEVGDAIQLIVNGRAMNSYITHISYKVGNYSTYECTIGSLVDNKATYKDILHKK